MAGDNESRFGVLAGLIACLLMLALTVMAFGPGATPSVFQALSIDVGAATPELPLPTETPSFAMREAV